MNQEYGKHFENVALESNYLQYTIEECKSMYVQVLSFEFGTTPNTWEQC